MSTSTTFYTGAVVDAYGSSFVGLTDVTNVQINPATENGNLASIASALNVNLSTIASEITLAALNTKVVTTANGIKVDGSAVTQPVSGTVTANIQSTLGGALTATGTSLNVNITGGSSSGEQHAVEAGGDLYVAGTTKGDVAVAHVISLTPSLTAGQFSSLNVSVAGRLIVDGSGVTQPVSAASLPLPTGAATETTLAAVDTKLGSFTFASTRLLVDGSGVTQPVSAVALPLPAGASTSALQTTGNSSLSSIDGKTPALGQALMAASVPVTLASNQSALGVTGPLTDTQLRATAVPVSGTVAATQSGTWNVNNVSGTVSLPTGAATEATLLAAKVDLDKLTFTATRLLVDGSGVTQPVSAVALPLPAGAATSALQTTGNTTLSTISGKLPATLGQKVMSASLAVTLASDQTALSVSGPLTDTQLRAATVPVSGTVTSKLQDGAGNAITSTGGALNVSIATPLSVDITGNSEDLDTGGGIDNHEVFAIGLPGLGGHVVGGTATNPLRVDPVGSTTQPVSVSSLPLPTGAATEATLLAAKVDLDKLTFTATRLLVDGSGVTQPVSAVALPLPAGAATSALQTTGNSSLSSIDGKTPALGQALMVASVPVTLASDQSTLTVTGPLTDTQLRATAVPVSGTVAATQSGAWNIVNISGTVSLPTGAATETTLSGVKTQTDKLTFTSTKLQVENYPAYLEADDNAIVGSQTLPVGINLTYGSWGGAWQRVATNGSNSLSVAVASSILPTGAATETTLAAVDTKLGSFTFASTRLLVDGSGVTQPVSAVALPLPAGASTSALQTTGNSSLSSIDGKTPALGQALMVASVPVTLASDQSTLTVTGPLTDTQLRATAVPVSGPLTDTQLRATAVPVSGTVAATQSGAWNIADISGVISLPTGAATEATLLATKVDLDKFTFASTRLLVDGSGVTQPVSGTITANIGTTNGLALDTTLARSTALQGALLAANYQTMVGGSVTAAAPAYIAGTIQPLNLDTSGNLRVTTAGGATTVVQATGTNLHAVIDSGTITANAGTGSFTVAQATGTNLHTVIDSGSVTANIGTAGGLALESTQVKLAVSQSAALGSNAGPMVQGSVSTAAPSYTNGNINPLSLTPTGALRVDGSAVTQPVSGTVTANIGTGTVSTNLVQVLGAAPSVTNPIPMRLGDGTNYFESVPAGVDHYLGVAAIQDGHISAGNSSVANLAGGATFTGTGVSTLVANCIDVSLKADQGCTLTVQQSSDNVNWDISDTFVVYAGVGASYPVTATAEYFRVVVHNNNPSIATTYFRLTSKLLPIGDNLPRSIGGHLAKDSLSVTLAHDSYGQEVLRDSVFSVTGEITLATTATTNFLLIENPITSGKNIVLIQAAADVVTKGSQIILRMSHTPTTPVAGTTITPINRYIGSATAATTTASLSPTGTEVVSNKFQTLSVGKDSNSLINEFNGKLILQPGKNILITATASANNTTVACTLTFAEYVIAQ